MPSTAAAPDILQAPTRSPAAIAAQIAETIAAEIVAKPAQVRAAVELLDEGAPRPALILAFPFGFVGAAEAKQMLVDDPRGVPVYLIDPNGFVILRYPPGFDPAGLRADLAKLLKLK